MSLFALFVLSPVFLVVAAIIKLDSPGPVFYRRRCYGKGGRLFDMLKFRSMVADADNLFDSLSENEKEEYRKNYKIANDPRITKAGRRIRRFSINETPQFLNILKGEMSLVGPRPATENEIANYRESRDKLLSIRPGLTGYWQVNSRQMLYSPESIAMQLHYVESFSLLMDIKIFFKTFAVVLRGTGT